MKFFLLFFVVLFFSCYSHEKKSTTSSRSISSKISSSKPISKKKWSRKKVRQIPPPKDTSFSITDLKLSDFYFSKIKSFHPLVVHLPLVLIPLTFLLVLGLIWKGGQLFLPLVLISGIFSWLGTFLAVYPIHPHTSGLTLPASRTLARHDYFADITFVLISISLFMILLYWIARLRSKILVGVLVVMLLGASVSVLITGHFGTTLTYVHGVGVKGKFLEKNH